VGLGGWAIGNTERPAPAPPTVAPSRGHALLSAGLSAAGHPIGQAFAYTGTSPWMYLTIDADSIDLKGEVHCTLVRGDGSTATIGPFPVVRGYAHWGGPHPAGSAPLSGIRLLTADGSVVATGTFAVAKR
jgi:hypothetical protein